VFATYSEPVSYTSVYAYNRNSDSFFTVSEPSPSIETYYSYNVDTQSYIPMQPPKEVFYEANSCPIADEASESSTSSYVDYEEYEEEARPQEEDVQEFYVTTFTNEPSPYSLYFYDSETNNFYETEPNQYVSKYYNYRENTRTFVENTEPLEIEESEHVNPTELYFYDTITEDYYQLNTPSPFISEYYTYNPTTVAFESYTGRLDYPDIYSYDLQTNTYTYVSEPTQDAEFYYYYDFPTQSFLLYANPTPTESHDFTSIPQWTPTEYYAYDSNTYSYYYVPEPSPYITEYYTYDEFTSSYVPYEDVVSYKNLYTYDEGTDSYQQLGLPTEDSTEYYYHDDTTGNFNLYEQPQPEVILFTHFLDHLNF
jgi:hypothetical protein